MPLQHFLPQREKASSTPVRRLNKAADSRKSSRADLFEVSAQRRLGAACVRRAGGDSHMAHTERAEGTGRSSAHERCLHSRRLS
eukprot:5324823-Pleurochrysis_carterae.AAC.1